MNATPARTWLPLLAVTVTLVLWASAFVAIRHLGKDFEPGSLSLGRLLVGAATLGAVVLTQSRMPRPTGREWVSIVAIGVLWFGVYNVSLNEGEHHVDAGTASMLLQVSPILIAVLATMFLGEKFTTYLTIGLALAFSGVVLIGTADSDSGSRDVSLTVSRTIVVRVERTPGMRPIRARSSVPRCSGSRARTFTR